MNNHEQDKLICKNCGHEKYEHIGENGLLECDEYVEIPLEEYKGISLPQEESIEWAKEFDEKFGDNEVWWQECIAEMRIGDPDFNRLKSFIKDLLHHQAREIQEKTNKLLRNYGIDVPYVGAPILNREMFLTLLSSYLPSNSEEHGNK